MTNVKRWGQTWDGIFPQDDGDFVEFDEYQKLKAQRDELLAALNEIVNSLDGENYQIVSRAIAKCEAQS